MSNIYVKGKQYGGSVLPAGGSAGQALIKNSGANGDVKWGAVIQTIQTETVPTASADFNGMTIQYVGPNDGVHFKNFFYECKQSGSTYSWVNVNVQPDAGDIVGIVIFSYIVGSTAFAANWLSKTPGGVALTPEAGQLYLVLTSGEFHHNFLRWDASEEKYIVVASGGLVEGYYNSEDHKFYEDEEFTMLLAGEYNTIYVSVDTNMGYWYDGRAFNALSANVSPTDRTAIYDLIDVVDASVPLLVEYTEEELDEILDQIDFTHVAVGGAKAFSVEEDKRMSRDELQSIWDDVFKF